MKKINYCLCLEIRYTCTANLYMVSASRALFIWQYGASLKSGSLISFLPMCIYYIWTKWVVYKLVSYPNIFVLYESSGINVTVVAWVG